MPRQLRIVITPLEEFDLKVAGFDRPDQLPPISAAPSVLMFIHSRFPGPPSEGSEEGISKWPN